MMQTVVQDWSTFTRMLNDWSLLMQMDSQTIIICRGLHTFFNLHCICLHVLWNKDMLMYLFFFFFFQFCHFCLYSYRGQEEKMAKRCRDRERTATVTRRSAAHKAIGSYVFLFLFFFLMKINFSVWHSACTLWRHNVQKMTY